MFYGAPFMMNRQSQRREAPDASKRVVAWRPTRQGSILHLAPIRNLGVRAKIFAGYIAVLLMAFGLLTVSATLTGKTRGLLTHVSDEIIPTLIALDTLLETGLRLTNASDRLAFAAADAADGKALPKAQMTAYRAAVADADRQFSAAIGHVQKFAVMSQVGASAPRIIKSAESMRTVAASLVERIARPQPSARDILATRVNIEVQSDTLGKLVNRTIYNQRRALTTNQNDANNRIELLLISVFAGVVVICLATLLGGKIVSDYIIRPIARQRDSAERVGRGDFRAPPEKFSNDEIGMLVDAFRAMMNQLQSAQAQLLRGERFATLGQVAGTVSHELRNPLGVIQSSIAIIRKMTAGKELGVDRALERADRNIQRCAHIIGDILEFTRERELVREATPIDEWLNDCLDEHAIAGHIAVQRDLRCASTVALDRERFLQVMVNLLDNAAQALNDPAWTPAEGHRRTIAIRTEAAGPHVRLSVIDNGPGIAEDKLAKIFEPLFTTKSFGVGLGLPTVQRIVEQHGATIDVASRVDEGTTFLVRLPRLEATGAAERGIAPATQAA